MDSIIFFFDREYKTLEDKLELRQLKEEPFTKIEKLIAKVKPKTREEEFQKAENIIKNKIPCEDLTEEDLEILGDYFMEQMHPGEAHEQMDEMMGGEGSESLRQIHINMGRSFYCGDHDEMSHGMMNTMMGRGNMMRTSYSNYGSNLIFSILINLVIILAIVYILVLIIKNLKSSNKKAGKKRK